ncbi:WbqC family protein [Paenibacillus amylolyticus]|nr:WbqC family protein [Paenibacillus amylolyticus]
MNKVAVLQSNYLPWKGYFDIINDVDTFIFYDDVQYTKNDWRNRNKVKSTTGAQWLTIPVNNSNDSLICEVMLPNSIGM